MGAIPRSSWGGRWTAVYSLWTYVHRVLHVLGIAAVDEEEVALLSGPLVRIRARRPRRRSVVLAHHPDPLHPDEPIGWVDPAAVPLQSTLFFLHFDTSNHARPDRARLATATHRPNSPRAWLTVDHKTGLLGLTVSELHAAVFDVRVSSSRVHDAEVTLTCTCTAGQYLSVHSDTMRARVCANSAGTSETFRINNVPVSPTLATERDEEPPNDCTMAAAYRSIRSSPVRIQSHALGWFLASKPGAPLAASGGKESGWDGFTLEYDSPTRSAKLRDSRGLYLAFGPDLDNLLAATDPETEHAEEEDCEADEVRNPENFVVEMVRDDDRVVLRSRKGYLSARRGGRIVLSKDTVPGKREQFYLRLALPSMMDQSKPRLRLRTCTGGARQVEASVLVPAHAKIAYEVLRDYDGFSEFISDASESRTLERRSDTELSVLMVQCHSFLMLTIPMTMVLNVREDHEERVVTMDLERGLGVKQYKGVWRAVERQDGRCLIRCTLLASTAVPAPGFLIDGLMSHATMSTMEQLRTECIRRSSADHLKSPRRRSRSFSVESPVLHRAVADALVV